MGHCWPGQPTCLFGTPNTELSANDEMWAFFQQNPLP
jgi:poly(3-hydroxybutyrate) depolymerase